MPGPILGPRVVSRVRRLRAVGRVLEAGLFLVLAGSALAFGSVHPWAYVPLWCACLLLGAAAAARALLVGSLRGSLGAKSVLVETAQGGITLEAWGHRGDGGWSFDLEAPVLPKAALLSPGVVFLVWVLAQLAPLPPALASLLSPGLARLTSADPGRWHPLTASVPDTLRGLAFLFSALTLHVVAATVLGEGRARRRFLRVLSGLALLLAVIGLAQLAAETRRIYGFFQPWEEDASIFGPFVNRNHFAGYMLLAVPATLSVFSSAYRRYAGLRGSRSGLRRWLVNLGSAEGAALIYSCIPAMASVAALLATTSRGALLAFASSLLVVGVIAKESRVRAWAPALVFVAAGLAWFGIERLEQRFTHVIGDSLGRTVVWKDSLQRMEGLWLTGSGFNTFGQSMSHASPWTLPAGATPWPADLDPSRRLGPRGGYRTPEGVPGLLWYREAHNDYVQVLVEAGVPGLVLAAWAALSTLRAVSGDPWLLLALTGLLLHEIVDFDLQIPAIAVLFVTMAGIRAEPGQSDA